MQKKRIISEEEKNNIVEDFQNGMNTVELGKKYNRNNTTIGRLLKKNGLTARNVKTKMTEEQIKEAYLLYIEKLFSTEELSKMYKVDANTIANSFRRLGFEVRPKGHIPEFFNDSFFKTIDSESKAYFLGFIMCDGSIVNDKGHYALHIEIQERDREILDTFVDEIGLSKERVKTYTRTDKTPSLTTVKVAINSNKLCNDLIQKGVIRKKTGRKSIPLYVPDALMRHTLRGMIDADGSVFFKNKSIVLFGGGNMTKQVSEYLFINLKLSKKPHCSNYEDVVPRMRTYLDDFETITNYLYKEANFCLRRKNPFVNWLAQPSEEATPRCVIPQTAGTP